MLIYYVYLNKNIIVKCYCPPFNRKKFTVYVVDIMYFSGDTLFFPDLLKINSDPKRIVLNKTAHKSTPNFV